MEIGTTLYVTNRRQWRTWLARHHKTASEIWLIYYKKHSGKPRIPYNDAVEEALCYGWIDSLTKPMDEYRWAQRFSPRRPSSRLSEMNRERVRRLIAARRMTKAGLERIAHVFDHKKDTKRNLKWRIPPDILMAIKRDRRTWQHFRTFSESYKRIRVGWIDAARRRPEAFRQRLRHFLKMTALNKRFGMVQ
jgi:uncharacterized protein YdeI (YjbR/CyaY-like superfamily)